MKSICTNLRHASISALLLLSQSCTYKAQDVLADRFVEDTRFKVVGYLTAGAFDKIDQIDLTRLTHLDLAFLNPDEDGNLVFSEGKDIKSVVAKAHAANVQVFISIAGGGSGVELSPKWDKVLQPEQRPGFINKLIKYVEDNDLDGIDVDIEWNILPTVGSNYTPFVLELRDELHARGKSISTALPATALHEAVTQESLEAYDFINVMVYDATGPWTPDRPGHHSTYELAEAAVDFWLDEKKIPANRLVLGMPFYGYDFGSEKISSKSYGQITADNPADAYRDDIDQLYYNGIPTIVKKTQLALSKFNGVMFWQLGHDAMNELSLLAVVDQVIQAKDCQGMVTTFYADSDADGFGDISKPFQSCSAPEGFVSNNTDCNDSDPNINPNAKELQDGIDNNCNGEIDDV